MSTSLLQKSLKLFEENSIKSKKSTKRNIKKHGKRRKQIIQQHIQKEEIKNKIVEENLQKLKLLTSYSVSSDISSKIIQYSVKGGVPLDLQPKVQEKTAFSEEDFEAFEKEYVIEN